MWEETKRVFLESIERTLSAIARFLPALLAMVLIVLASLLLSWLARSLVRRLTGKVGFDQRLRAWGVVAPASEGRTPPSVLIARFASWTVIALGFLVGLSVFDAPGSVALQLLGYAPKALVGLGIFVVGVTGSRALERSVLIGSVNAGLQSARVLGLGARWLVILLAAAMGLEQLGVGGTILIVSFAILFGGIVLALALAVGLGVRVTVARSIERVLSGLEQQPKERDEGAAGAPHEEEAREYHHM
jgi:hypothetical protein